MKIRLFEIEYGVSNPKQTQTFFQDVLGLTTKLDEPQLKVMDAGLPGLDFNCSTHIAAPGVITSFITDDLDAVIQQLQQHNITFTGPRPSHLGMLSIECNSPDGYLIRINAPTEQSPEWLKAG